MREMRGVAGVGVVVGLLAFPLAADDGDLDPSFDGGAFTLGWTAGHARATALEPIAGGELLVGGTVGALAGEIDGWAVAKLEADGTRDLAWALAFEIVSAVDEAPLGTETLFDLGRDDQERTLLAGAAGDGVAGSPPMLARLTPGGALDTAFDGNGIRVVDDAPAGWQDVRTTAAIVLADGRSVFVGSCEDCPLAGDDQVWVTRRLADGAPDPAFSTDGWYSFRFAEGGNSEPTAVAVDSGGRIVVGGIVSDPPFADLYLARLTPAGALDASFGDGDGIAGPAVADAPDGLALDPSSGRIALAIGDEVFPGDGEVRVFTPAGAPDGTFSTDGVVELDLEEGSSIAAVAFQSDGKLLAVGTIDATGTNEGGFLLVRLTRTGGLDASYDDNGVKRVEFDAAANVEDRALAVATMGGRLVAAGFAGAGGGEDEESAVVRTESALVFADGFEGATTGAWAGE